MTSPPSDNNYRLVDSQQIYSIAGNVRLLCTNLQYIQDSIARVSENLTKVTQTIEKLSSRVESLEEKVEYIHQTISFDNIVHIHTTKHGMRSITSPKHIVLRQRSLEKSPFKKTYITSKTLEILRTIDVDENQESMISKSGDSAVPPPEEKKAWFNSLMG